MKKLLDPACYDHPVDEVECIETHISWVYLAGEYAYKLKKPLDLGFLDFSSLSRRKFYCAEELRLNRRFAPELYLDVVCVGGSYDHIHIGQGPVIDYLVKMKRFDQEAQLDRMLRKGSLNGQHMQAFAERIAEFHMNASVAPANGPHGSPDAVICPALENFSQIRKIPAAQEIEKQIGRIEEWTRECGRRLAPYFVQRQQAGFIRECHGDLHLRNMAMVENRPLLFDCVEFSEELRWIDTINDIAFLLMDLDDHGQSEMKWTFLDAYLQTTGDYEGLALLGYYQVYRAMVRAKVICMRLDQQGMSAEQRSADLADVKDYLALAEKYLDCRQGALVLTHGLSGAGKTLFVNHLAAPLSAICLHSDTERKRIHGLNPDQRSGSPVAGGIYTKEARNQAYRHLEKTAADLLQNNFRVIVDATFIGRNDRERMRNLAAGHKVPFVILDFDVPDSELRRRIRERNKNRDGQSEADEAVLDYQVQHAEPLSPDEEKERIRITAETSQSDVVAALSERV